MKVRLPAVAVPFDLAVTFALPAAHADDLHLIGKTRHELRSKLGYNF